MTINRKSLRKAGGFLFGLPVSGIKINRFFANRFDSQ